MAKKQKTYADKRSWDEIPERFSKNARTQRAAVVKRAARAAYDGGDDPVSDIIDLLTDIRHACDKFELCFDVLNRQAIIHYAEELKEMKR